MPLTDDQITTMKAKLMTARDLIDAALIKIEEWLNLNEAHAHFNDVIGKREDLVAERAEISAKLAALDARDSTLQPPSSARIEKVMKLSNELEAEIRNAEAGSSVLAIAAKAVELAAEASTVGTA